MSEYGTHYLIDNNTLNQLTKEQRSSDFFRDHVRIPSEVLYEARDASDIQILKGYEYGTSPGVLNHLVSAMKSVPVGDTALVDLYQNQGNADPLLIACALDARDGESGYLDPQDWVLVTSDKAVRLLAEYFQLTVISNKEFAAVIDGAL